MAAVVAVANQKGGVGKTVYTVNMAAAFALMLSQENPENPERVLVLDMDPQANANATLSGGIWTDANKRIGADARLTLGDYLMNSATTDPVKSVLTSGLPISGKGNLDFFPTQKGKMKAAMHYLDAEIYDGDSHLKEILDLIIGRYRFVFIDTPPSLNTLTLNALVSAKHMIVPVKMDGFAWDGFNDVMATVELVKKNSNPELTLLGIQPSQCNFRKAGEEELYNTLKADYADIVLPPFSFRADYDYAKEEGMDIFSYRPGREKGKMAGKAEAAREFAAIAQQVRKVIW